jgi:hypothetical protein
MLHEEGGGWTEAAGKPGRLCPHHSVFIVRLKQSCCVG